ncbi:MAG: FHA domain-containing protein [Ilumatobacteraceae bacterium]
MTDQVLEILKYAFLALLYLFFARVLWAVWSEVRGPRPGVYAPSPVVTEFDATNPVGVAPQPARRNRKGRVNRLVVLEPRERKGATFLVNTELRIGRTSNCAISIPDDAFVSQIHARVFTSEGTTWLEDLGSTNGTYLNGERVTNGVVLNKGDRIQIGASIWEAN